MGVVLFYIYQLFLIHTNTGFSLNVIAQKRFGKNYSQLSSDEQREIMLDLETAFLEGDTSIRVPPDILSGKAYRRGRAGQEKMAEGSGGKAQPGETIRNIQPHGEHHEGDHTHIPLE